MVEFGLIALIFFMIIFATIQMAFWAVGRSTSQRTITDVQSHWANAVDLNFAVETYEENLNTIDTGFILPEAVVITFDTEPESEIQATWNEGLRSWEITQDTTPEFSCEHRFVHISISYRLQSLLLSHIDQTRTTETAFTC